MRIFARTFGAACAAALALSGCATDRTFGEDPGVEITDLTTLPAPRAPYGYSLAPLDQVEVRVLQYDAVNGNYLIGNDGIIDFPLIGPIAAEGLSPAELSNAISTRLADGFVINPDVSVMPVNIARIGVSFGGEISSPGNIAASEVPTLLRGINEAGGLTEYAKHDDVLIMREVGGVRYIGVYNIGAIARGNYPDPALYAGDIVMVGDSPARRRVDSILQYLPLLTTSLILADRIDRLGN